MLNTIFGVLFGKAHSLKGEQLAEELSAKYSPDFDTDGQKKISEKRLTRILEGIYNKALDYKKDTKLGFFGVARLTNAFRWKLEELGYRPEFVKVATEGLTIYLARK